MSLIKINENDHFYCILRSKRGMVIIFILIEEKGDTDTNSDTFHIEKLIQFFPVQEFRKIPIRYFSQKVSDFRYRYDSIEDLFKVKEWMSQTNLSFAKGISEKANSVL